MFEKPKEYFEPGKYLLADSGYTVSDVVIPCLKRCAGHSLRREEDAFNKAISALRVIIEHCNGMLKGRFQSLKELRLVISNALSALRANEWIEVCLILHNFLLSLKEAWSPVFGSITEALRHDTRVQQPPAYAPTFENDHILRSDRDTRRRDHLFSDFLTTLSTS